MTNTEMKTKCVLCGKPIVGDSHNPFPLSEEGRCCTKCNRKVLIARIKQFGRMMIDAEMLSQKGK